MTVEEYFSIEQRGEERDEGDGIYVAKGPNYRRGRRSKWIFLALIAVAATAVAVLIWGPSGPDNSKDEQDAKYGGGTNSPPAPENVPSPVELPADLNQEPSPVLNHDQNMAPAYNGPNIDPAPFSPSIPAPVPGSVPTSSPITTSSPFCDAEFKCQTRWGKDRWGQHASLSTGQAICNMQYRFGMFQNGTFGFYDCEQDYGRSVFHANATTAYFAFDESATLRIWEKNGASQPLWTKVPNREIKLSEKCLHKPELDCPYFHLHPDSVMVLNYIDKNGGWQAKNIKSCYDDLFMT